MNGKDDGMKVHGLNKTTLLDYPGHLAATVFTGGCNFRCPFCHNRDLVLEPEGQPLIPEEEVLAHLGKRRGILEGVCVTGGEPTLQPDLPDFIRKVKELGYLVKLDTNGYRPEVLAGLLEAGLLDYVAMDVKAPPGRYAAVSGCPTLEFSRIRESIGCLRQGNVPYEFRTTVVKGLHRKEEFEEIGKLLEGSSILYLQAFRESENLIGEGFGTFSREEMEEMAETARKYVDRVELRGIE